MIKPSRLRAPKAEAPKKPRKPRTKEPQALIDGTQVNLNSFSPLLLKIQELESRIKDLEAFSEALRGALRE